MELISHNERAQTYKASWRGHDVVVKKCDIWNKYSVAEELKNEAKVYQKLHRLQGRHIPKLWLAGIADGLEMLLVIDFVGTDVSQELLDDSAPIKIREAMSAIHELGVVHGDIRPQNIVMQHRGPNAKFFFVDFGFSRFTVDRTELFQEIATLNSLLRNIAAARSLSHEETGY
ncbi:kinase-like domain-containing protein [Dissophora ornata]|nr:kinase-like domain-containing protein [Dissophora ornata]